MDTPTDDKKPALTRDEAMLRHAGGFFEMFHPVAGEPVPAEATPEPSQWRQHSTFSLQPQNHNYAFSIVTRECRAALEDNEYALQHGLASTPKRTPFRYTPAEKGALERLLRIAIYPQIATQGFERFKETANAGMAEPNEALATHMQNLALMRHYLAEICTEMNDHTGDDYSPRLLTFAHTRKALERLATGNDYALSTRAGEMLDVSDYVQRLTATLAADINAQAGVSVLAKENVVELPRRSR